MSVVIIYRDKFSKRRKTMRSTIGYAEECIDRLRCYGHSVLEIKREP